VFHQCALERRGGRENHDSRCVSRFLRFSWKGGGGTAFPGSKEKVKRLVGFLAFLAFPHQRAAKKRKQTRPKVSLCDMVWPFTFDWISHNFLYKAWTFWSKFYIQTWVTFSILSYPVSEIYLGNLIHSFCQHVSLSNVFRKIGKTMKISTPTVIFQPFVIVYLLLHDK
jgi:hypothetical protein